jgi:hypothetical protein
VDKDKDISMNPKIEPTGNPVFDFQYAWRRRAASIQKWLIVSGLFSLLISFALIFCPACSVCSVSSCCGLSLACGVGIVGVLLMGAGIAWGFFWRNKLRDDFRRTYGADSDSKE